MVNYIEKIIEKRKTSIFWYSISLLLLIILYVSLYPSLSKSSGVYIKLIKSMPSAFKSAFGFSNLLNFTLLNFLSTEYLSLLFLVILIFFTISFASSQISGEIENKTIGVILSLPLSRIKIYLSKYIVGVIGIIILSIFGVISIVPVAVIMNIKVSSESVYLISLIAFLFSLATLSIGFCISSIFSKKGLSNTISVIIFLIMYIANIRSSVDIHLKFLRYISFFYYYNVNNIITHNHISYLSVSVFLDVFIFFSLLGMFIFYKRDIEL